jgi:hypothetical protein
MLHSQDAPVIERHFTIRTAMAVYSSGLATLSAADRQLRPAEIARKISCGNKALKDAPTWQILALLAATCAQ